MDNNWNKQNKMKETPMICFLNPQHHHNYQHNKRQYHSKVQHTQQNHHQQHPQLQYIHLYHIRNMTCTSVFQNYRKDTMQQHLRLFNFNAETEYD